MSTGRKSLFPTVALNVCVHRLCVSVLLMLLVCVCLTHAIHSQVYPPYVFLWIVQVISSIKLYASTLPYWIDFQYVNIKSVHKYHLTGLITICRYTRDHSSIVSRADFVDVRMQSTTPASTWFLCTFYCSRTDYIYGLICHC